MKAFAVFAFIALTTCGQTETQPVHTATSAPVARGSVQEYTIDVTGTFSPASITLKSGQPARIHFRRGSEATCADEIVFPDLGIRKKLAANQTVTVELPPQQKKTLTFVCGMNMMKGAVVVQ